MGSYLSRRLGRYLGTAEAALPRPAWRHGSLRPRPARRAPGPVQSQVISVHRARWIRSRPRLPRPPHLEHPRVQRPGVPEAWRRPHAEAPLRAVLGWDLSSYRESFVKQCLWKAQNLLHIWNMVTVRIPAPEGRARFGGGPPAPERPDPRAAGMPPRAPGRGRRGRKRSHRLLRFEGPPAKRRRQSPGARPSAFRPVWKDGVVRCFEPRPGPLRRGLCPWHPGDGEDPRPGPDLPPGRPHTAGGSRGLA